MTRLARWLFGAKALLLFRRRVAVFGNFTAVDSRRILIGRRCAINHGVFLNGLSGIRIGDDVILSARCIVMAAALDPRGSGDIDNRHHIDVPITIGDGCWIGAGAIILGGVNIGSNSVVGAGAVVTRDVAPRTIVAGNPAKVIGSTAKLSEG